MMAAGAREQTWKTFRQYGRLILLLTIPATVILIGVSQPLVRIFFERGEFTSADTAVVSQVQRYCLLQLPLAMLAALAARLISSFKSNDTLLWGSLVAVASQVALTRALLPTMNVSGVALAASVSSFIYLCYLLVVLSRWNRAVFSSIPAHR
jgi:putative peptidoglycan lipid II flippase